MSAHSPMLQQASLLSGRHSVMLVIIALHGLFISLLMAVRIVPDAPQPPPPPLIGHIDPPELVTPPPPEELIVEIQQPTLTKLIPDFDVVIPEEISVPVPASDSPSVPVEPRVRTVDPPVRGVTVAPAVPPTALQYRVVRPARDYYPLASITLQEEGIAIVQVCVGPSGQLNRDPVIQQSSGSKRLDAAALKWAREALQFTPATRDGAAVAACKGFRVNFTLR